MQAHFVRHAYDPHSHDDYLFGVTEQGVQAFRCRGGAWASSAGMIMAFNPDEPHDGHAGGPTSPTMGMPAGRWASPTACSMSGPTC